MKQRKFITTGIIGGFTVSGLTLETFAKSPTEKGRCITNKINKKPLKPFYVKPEETLAFRTTKIKFDQVNNQFCAVEHSFPPKTMGPAPHVHNDLDEIMRVLKGTVTVLVGEELFEVKEGGWHVRPHGIPHTFWNAGDEPAIYIEFYPNQNFDVFLDELKKLSSQFKNEGICPESNEARKLMDELHKEWGMVIYHDQRKPLMDKYGLK